MNTKVLFIAFSILTATAHAFDGGSSTVGPGNPASYNCLKLGGVLERTPSGSYSNCVIECWKLYREMAKRNLVKPRDHENVSMPNPAAVNCLDLKGTLRPVRTLQGQRTDCVVAQWDLFRAIDVTREQENIK